MGSNYAKKLADQTIFTKTINRLMLRKGHILEP